MHKRQQRTHYRTPDDDYVFDEFGNLIRVDRKWGSPDYAIVENSKTKSTSRYQFSDARADVQQIKSGVITGIVFVSVSRITRMIANAGAMTTANREMAKDYLLKEGKGRW